LLNLILLYDQVGIEAPGYELMKIAHLILAHSGPEQLQRLISRMAHPNAYFFVHIDAKADIGAFTFLAKTDRVFFVEKRVKVRWGAYSIVQATLNGFKAILDSAISVNRINLLSGSDYPLANPENVHRFFEENRETNFMEFQDVISVWKEAIPRVTEYHLDNYSFPGKYLVQNWINRLLPARKMPAGLTPVGRSQWMSLTAESVQYILQYLDEHSEVARFFKLTWAPDEMIFQTILYSSRYRESLLNDNLRYVDWSAGEPSPKLLTGDDLEKLLKSGKLFARKFDMKTNPEILDLLDERIFINQINL